MKNFKMIFAMILFSILLGGSLIAQNKNTLANNSSSDSLNSLFSSHPPNLFQAELFGNGGTFSLNYEYYFSEQFSIRIGLSGLEYEDESTRGKAWFHTTSGILIMTDYLFFQHLEVGVGVNFLLNSNERCNLLIFDYLSNHCSSIFLTGRIGFRTLPKDNGYSFGIAMTPFVNFNSLAMRLWFGASIGYAF